ncbi:hypothetical protein [Streptomyces sp. YPW6]|uniref:hypothetical protein n=1 Tax=Streptomyces sp. YPW6 TaxID=2840373 RepID=UPI003D722A8F
MAVQVVGDDARGPVAAQGLRERFLAAVQQLVGGAGLRAFDAGAGDVPTLTEEQAGGTTRRAVALNVLHRFHA